jgi:hypothetical protein
MLLLVAFTVVAALFLVAATTYIIALLVDITRQLNRLEHRLSVLEQNDRMSDDLHVTTRYILHP